MILLINFVSVQMENGIILLKIVRIAVINAKLAIIPRLVGLVKMICIEI